VYKKCGSYVLPCSDKGPSIEEKDEDEGYEECCAYRAVTKIFE
jgi:hypothetical protein